MAKTKANIPSILEAPKTFVKGKFRPVYLFFGNDSYSIDEAVKELDNAITPLIGSDFDREVIFGDEKVNLSQLLSMASAFPFGAGKKFIVVKEFDKVKDIKSLTPYLQNPPDFTTIVFIHNGELKQTDKEPYLSLVKQNFIFEAKELKGENLIAWLIEVARKNKKELSHDNAALLTEISGYDRSMLENQLDKIFLYMGEKTEIDFDIIKSLSTSLKENTIFDLQDALGSKNKKNSVKVLYNLLDRGAEPTFIIAMLTKYFSGLVRINEMRGTIPDAAAARIVGTHPFYYKNHVAAKALYSDKDLFRGLNALLNADILLKTTQIDPKSILTILITDILK
jgi:DNA polymerase III subunit delta